MNKKDFKKLALLGMAGGLLLSTQATEANEFQNADYGNYLAGQGCGSGRPGSGCSSTQGTRYQNNSQDWADNSQPNQAGQSGCAGKSNSQKTNAKQNSGMKPEDYSHVPYYNPNKVVAEANGATKSADAKLTEADLLTQLNAQGKAAYQTLSPEGKVLALKLANQSCKGKNDCKGMNSCKTNDHSCAGKGGCKGTSSCNFKDKNTAVKVAALKMAEKRASVTSPMQKN